MDGCCIVRHVDSSQPCTGYSFCICVSRSAGCGLTGASPCSDKECVLRASSVVCVLVARLETQSLRRQSITVRTCVPCPPHPTSHPVLQVPKLHNDAHQVRPHPTPLSTPLGPQHGCACHPPPLPMSPPPLHVTQVPKLHHDAHQVRPHLTGRQHQPSPHPTDSSSTRRL
jgi:hypothetical protein